MAYKSKSTLTRPADTTAYTAGDVVAGGAFKLKGMPGNKSDLMVTSVALAVHVASIPSGMTSFTLHLYDEDPPSAIADNAAWNLPAGDRANYLGSISMGSPAAVGGTPATLYVGQDQVNKQIRSGDNGVWGYLVTAGGYTPTSAAVKTVEAYAIAQI
jgi:hypothetical protein